MIRKTSCLGLSYCSFMFSCQYNTLIKPSLSDDEESQANSSFSEVPPEPVVWSSRRTSRSVRSISLFQSKIELSFSLMKESIVSIQSSKKDLPEAAVVPPVPSPVNPKASSEQPHVAPIKLVPEEDPSTKKNNMSGPSAKTEVWNFILNERVDCCLIVVGIGSHRGRKSGQ